MYNNTQIFKSKSFGEIKVITINGNPYFPATECAKLLGYANPRKAIRDHCKGGTKRDSLTAGGVQHINHIPESDLYRLITHSKLPSAKKFEKFVYETVLPTIRKYGGYIEPDMLEKIKKNPKIAEELLKNLHAEQDKNMRLTRQIEELEPKAHFCDDVLDCENLIQTSIIAKDYGMSAISFNRLLHDLRIQYKIGDTWVLYKDFAGKGYTKTRSYPVSENEACIHTYWTFKGQKFLYECLKFYGITPSYGYNADDDDLPY